MKRILIYFMLIAWLTSCSTIQQHNKSSVIIPYILPIDITQTLSEAIKDKNEPDLFFTLDENRSGNFSICLLNKEGFSNSNWVKNSNRQLLLNGKFFPLVLKYDDYFAVFMNGKELLIEMKKEQSMISRSIQIIEHKECYEFQR